MKQAFLVDDSKSARIVLSRLLKKNGFDEVEMAESGEQALEQLKAITPDAIFVDFLMDGMDGLETIMEIKKDPRFVTTPVVMCTANEGDDYVRAAVDHGALGILAKPPTDQSLGEIIAMIEEHQQEAAASDAAQPVSAPAEPPPATIPEIPPVDTAVAPGAVSAGLGEAQVQSIDARQTEQVIEEMVDRLVVQRVEIEVGAYLDKHLETLVERLVEQRLVEIKPQEINVEALRSQLVQEVHGSLEEFVLQLNQQTVKDLVESSIYKLIREVANDFTQQIKDTERRILDQVPEKNELVDHIRVVTEGSMEAHVQETATRVAQEISNSVATETVENLLDQHLAYQSLDQESSKSPVGWILGLLALATTGVGVLLYNLL